METSAKKQGEFDEFRDSEIRRIFQVQVADAERCYKEYSPPIIHL